jgi:hypothetical protein
VHSVAAIFPTNNTVFVNEPTYYKYAFDDNPDGNRRYYIENIPELQLQEGQWRLEEMGGRVYFKVLTADLSFPLLAGRGAGDGRQRRLLCGMRH